MEKVKTKLMKLKKYDNFEIDSILTAELACVSIASLSAGVCANDNLGAFCSGMVFITSAYICARVAKIAFKHYKEPAKSKVASNSSENFRTAEDGKNL